MADKEHDPKKVVPKGRRDLLSEVEAVLQKRRDGLITEQEADKLLIEIIGVGMRYP